MISKTASVTHTCGHKIEYQFIGANGKTQALIKDFAQRPCADCRIPLVWVAWKDQSGYTHFNLKRKNDQRVVAKLFGAQSFGWNAYVEGRYIGTFSTLRIAKAQAQNTYEKLLASIPREDTTDTKA